MATLNVEMPRLYNTGEKKEIIHMKVKANETFKAGDFVVDDGSGAVQEVADAGTSILGMALGNAVDQRWNTTNSTVPVAIADDDTFFIITAYGAQWNDNMVLAAGYGIKKVNGVHVIDLTNTTQKVFQILRKLKGESTDTNVLVLAKVLKTAQATD